MIERFFSIIIALLSAEGLFLQSGILVKKPRKNMFVYYTNLSNLIICLYNIFIFIGSFSREGKLYGFLSKPQMWFSMTMMIWVTHIIFHFVLGPVYEKISVKKYIEEHGEEPTKKSFFSKYVLYPMTMGGTGRYNDSRSYIGNVCVHYIVPLLSLVQWFICADKSVGFSVCFVWLIVPLVYFVFTMIRAKSGVPIDKTGSLYPYPFMDLDALGVKKFTVNIIVTLCAVFLLACVLYLAASLCR